MAGKYAELPGQKICQDCKIGTYSETTRAASVSTCLGCPAGTYSTVTGVNALEKCVDCQPGQASAVVGANECDACLPGKVSQSKETECEECRMGTTNNQELTLCDPCDLGRYGDASGCHDCPIGQYQDGKGETSCKECDADTYLNEEGKSSKADCIECSVDKSTGARKGNTKAASCLCRKEDFYQKGASDCQTCPDGADCSLQNGISLPQLVAVNGFW